MNIQFDWGRITSFEYGSQVFWNDSLLRLTAIKRLSCDDLEKIGFLVWYAKVKLATLLFEIPFIQYIQCAPPSTPYPFTRFPCDDKRHILIGLTEL